MNPKSSQISPNPASRYSKAKPLAAKIGVSAKSLFRWADDGLISRYKLNARVVLFNESEVVAYVERCKA